MKGKIIPLRFCTRQDSETGHEVIRMTPRILFATVITSTKNALPAMAIN